MQSLSSTFAVPKIQSHYLNVSKPSGIEDGRDFRVVHIHYGEEAVGLLNIDKLWIDVRVACSLGQDAVQIKHNHQVFVAWVLAWVSKHDHQLIIVALLTDDTPDILRGKSIGKTEGSDSNELAGGNIVYSEFDTVLFTKTG